MVMLEDTEAGNVGVNVMSVNESVWAGSHSSREP